MILGGLAILVYRQRVPHWLAWAFSASLAIWGLSAYLSSFAALYYQISQDHHGACMYIPPNPLTGKEIVALSKVDSFYFTVTTFTTTGYGDIRPFTAQCRMFVSLQMIIGFLLLTVLATLIVSQIGAVLSRR
jgi:hypothetical protein